MDSIAPIYPSLPVQEMMTEKQEPSTTVAPQPIASPGAPEVAPALLPQPSSTAGAPSTADPEHHSPQLYSPTKLEIDAHLIRQRLSYVRDDITTALSCAPSNSAAPEATRRQEPDAAPAQPVTTGAMADKGIKEGDEVSWQWSGGRPGGTAAEVAEEGKVSIETKRGNEVHKNAEPGNPAVKISRSGQDVVKKASELDVEEEGDKHKEGAGEEDKKDDEEDKPEENGEAQTGEKRKADEPAEEKEKVGKGAAKKQKKAAEPKENGEKAAASKKKGRPAKKGANGEAKETKKRAPKKAATESGEPRRSGRNASK